MEPALEALLRQVNLHEDVIWKFRINELCDRELFVAIDRDEDALRATMKSDFGLDPEKGFAHKREVAKVVKAWNTAKIQSEVKVKADAAARAHGAPVGMLEPDWASLMDAFKNKFGSHIPPSALPAQSYFESFEEMLANGTLKAVTLAHVVSAKEQELQDEARPEPSRQMGLHLDSTLTIQTKRRYMSAMPSSTEELRLKYRIMSNCWLLAQMRQPARHLFSDLTVLTFPTFCDELLSEKNFMLDKEVGGNKVVKPEWTLCMGYELELRKESIRLVREQNMSIQQAMRTAYRDQQHRLENWSNFLKLEHRASESAKDAQITALERRLKQMENRLNKRSRSPRGSGKSRGKQAALPAPAPMLALPAQAAQPKGQGKGKGQGKKGRGKGRGKQNAQNAQQGPNIQTFRELLHSKKRSRPEHFASPPGVCFAFNQKNCFDTACTRPHICVGAGVHARTTTAVVSQPERNIRN